MARGKNLTVAEKYSIKAMVSEGITLKKMAMHLGRTEKFIKDFIENSLLQEAVEEEVQAVERMISETTENEVLNHLVKSGMLEIDAISAINRVCKKLREPSDNVAALVKYCLRDISPKQLMVGKSHGRSKGVSVMTAAASEKTDDAKENRSNSSGAKGAIFRQDGTID